MRRTVLALAVALTATLALTAPAEAIGPGGWTHLGGSAAAPSLNGAVYTLYAAAPDVLYAGGAFSSAGGSASAGRIARYDGSAWHSIGAPVLNGSVSAIAYAGGRVFAGGQFTNAGGNANADFLAVYDGVAWQPFCTPAAPGPSFGGSVAALQIIGNTLFVGGAFQNGAGIAAADYLVACDLTTGAASSTVPSDGDFPGAVYALTADSNGTLYAGGGFINLDQIAAADHVAAYDGTWHAMGAGAGPGGGAVDDFVRSLTASGTNVYIGTDSLNVAGIALADHVARWNGSAWSAVGANTAGTDGWFPTSSFLNALAPYGSYLVATGSFQNANGTAAADNIAIFDGTSWHALGSDGAGNGPFIGNGLALALFRGQVVVGGSFTSAGGDTLAKYAAGHDLRLVDAWIGSSTAGPFLGNNVYSPSSIGEARAVSVRRGSSTTWYVKLQNDGVVPFAFKLKGTGSGTGFVARWYNGATDVTSQVRAGTYSTGTLAPGGTALVRFVVSLAASTAASVSFSSTGIGQPGAPTDMVRLVVKAT